MCGILWGWVKSLRSRKNAGMNIRNYHLFWWLMSRKIWALHPGHQISDRIPPIFSWPWSYPYTPTFIGWNSHHIGAKSQKSVVSKLFFLFFPRRKRGKTLTNLAGNLQRSPCFSDQKPGKTPFTEAKRILVPLAMSETRPRDPKLDRGDAPKYVVI